MDKIEISNFSKNLYELSENVTYEVIEKFNDYQNIDKTLTYIYIKALYLHIVKLYLNGEGNLQNFNTIYSEYENYLKEYYKTNNFNISNDLLKDILEAFGKSFEMMETLESVNVYDGYEFRHHIIFCVELLRSILQKKSNSEIRVDIFEDYISKLRKIAEDIIDYTSTNIK